MYFLQKLCCMCMCKDRMLINSTKLNKNLMNYYFKYLICDTEMMIHHKNSFFFCLKCYKQLKIFYKFANHCMYSKNLLKSYITDLVTNCEENLGLFNVAVAVENIDPDNRISDTVHANPTPPENTPCETTLKIINIRSVPMVVNSPRPVENETKSSPSTTREEIPVDDNFLKKMGSNFESTANSTTFNIERLIKNGDISLSVLGVNSDVSKTVIKQEVVDIEDSEEQYQTECDMSGINYEENEVPIQNVEAEYAEYAHPMDPDLPIHQRPKKRKRFSLSPIKRYVCKVCYKSFATPKNLQVHHMTHTDERPHGCTICGKRFRQLPHLNTHMMIHLNVRPFKCELCLKTFRQSAHLRAHEILHNDGKMFQCDICFKMYRSDANLRSHKKLVHYKEECGYQYVMT